MNNAAKSILLNNSNLTCVLKLNSDEYKSEFSGIRPMLEFIDSGIDFSGFDAADRIVGKAAAMLFVLCGIKNVYASVLSRSGEEVFLKNNIAYEYDVLTDNIINRSGNDICPMEKAVIKIDEPLEALEAIKMTIKEMKNNISVQNTNTELCGAS